MAKTSFALFLAKAVPSERWDLVILNRFSGTMIYVGTLTTEQFEGSASEINHIFKSIMSQPMLVIYLFNYFHILLTLAELLYTHVKKPTMTQGNQNNKQ